MAKTMPPSDPITTGQVDAVRGMIVRHVTVDRSRSPQAVLDATGRRQYTDAKVVATMPRGEGEETDVYFFLVRRSSSDDDIAKRYELNVLKPADPYSQAQVNIDNPAFADKHPNGTRWKDADGNWCFATFCRWFGERHVYVSRDGSGWFDDWWFAGVRK